MEGVSYYKCGECGYEFLGKSQHPTCPRCESPKLEGRDIKKLAGIDE